MPQTLGISVAICTWNRCNLLARTLNCLADAARPPHVALEVLIVNNACSDNTSAVVSSFDGRLPIRETYESQSGVARARNRALLESTGSYVAFIDDDVLVEKQWLATLADLVTRYPELVGRSHMVNATTQLVSQMVSSSQEFVEAGR